MLRPDLANFKRCLDVTCKETAIKHLLAMAIRTEYTKRNQHRAIG